jgi:hypothetical protein
MVLGGADLSDAEDGIQGEQIYQMQRTKAWF